MTWADAGPDFARTYAAYAAALRYEHLPTEVVAMLKRIVLDTLGTTLAANTLDEATQPLLRVARGLGGAPESTLLGLGDRVPAPLAALVNGGMAQALNYADTATDGSHLGPTAVPAALAAAERVGGVSGPRFLAAVAAGAELQARLATARAAAGGAAPAKPLRTQVWGYFAAAVSAGHVLGLTAPQLHSALGLALMACGGSMQVVYGGDPPAKAIYAAFPAHGGVLCALLAEQGLGAEYAQVFEGEAGLFALYHDGHFRPEVLAAGLGTDFRLLHTWFKPWPASGVTHPLVEAALVLAERQRLTEDAIARVHLRGGPEIRFCCEPTAERQRPTTAAAAANSVFYPVARALVHGHLGLADFARAALAEEGPLRLAARMTYAIENDLARAGVVEVTTTAGRQLQERVDAALGQGARPLSYARLAEKLLDCGRYAARPLTPAILEEVVARVDRLETEPDVAALAALLGGRAA
jgi:2-methylcitrate dehydratase PrpD